jgi:predicted phosphoribosyltransferase
MFRDRIDAGEQLGAALQRRGVAADVVVLETPAAFRSVGAYYRNFDQVSDAGARSYLHQSVERRSD